MAKSFSNRYIFIYSAVLVVVAALILTVVSVSLKPLQTKNQQAETKQMILKTIGIDATRDNAAELYAKHITEADGYYTFDGGIVLPLKGTGLWGPIWGYLALDSTSTVVGAVFDHKGETPGLGDCYRQVRRSLHRQAYGHPSHPPGQERRPQQPLRGGCHQRRHHDQQRRDRHAGQSL